MWVLLSILLCVSSLLTAGTAANCPSFPWNTTFTATALSQTCGPDDASQVAACSLLRNGCDNASPSVCNSTRLLSSVCVDRPELAACSRLLQEYPGGAGPACLKALALPLPASSTLLQNALTLCAADNTLPGCEGCRANNCTDPLSSLVQGCASFNNTPACTNLTQFCGDVTPTNLPAVCLVSSSSTQAQAPLCVRQSSRPECNTYKYPDANVLQDVTALCNDMSDMTMCTLHALCTRGAAKGPDCSPFALLASGCTEMSGMADCGSYNKLCAADSTVQQCKQEIAIKQLPTTSQTRSSIISSCSTHFMPSCHTCTNEMKSDACPDPLTSLSKVCQEHPSMAACQLLYSFCTGSTKATFRTLCPASGSAEVLPSMMQYLHQRVDEVVLFRGWVTRSNGVYAASLLAIVCFGVISQFLKTLRSVLDAKWMVKSWNKHLVQTQQPKQQAEQMQDMSPFAMCFVSLKCGKQLKRNVVRTLLTAVILTLDYWNMLVCMTFNVGMFVAVITGYCIGTFLFSHVVEVLRLHSKQPLDDSAFYENGAAALAAADLGESEDDGVVGKDHAMKSLSVDACGCKGLSEAQVQQVVQMSMASNQCEGCA